MTNRTSTLQIENFSLFGEAAELSDVVHCETIETRSPLHDWEFKPHRHQRLHQILLLDQGGGTAELDGQFETLSENSILNVPTGCVHSFVFHTRTKGWVVTLAAELLDELLLGDEGLRPVLARPYIATGDESHRAIVRAIFDEHAELSFARAQMLRALSAQLLAQVARTIRLLDDSDEPSESDPLQIKFDALLEKHFSQQWSVADYARELSVSPTHLSRVLRSTTGLPASRIIEARIVREARRHLFFTNLGVSQIAYLLGYEDPAYFSRVFSRATGVSPKAFRSQMEPGA